MALNCPINVIHHTSPDQKRASKNSIKQYKYGSPKIRDVLREKCKQRIKEAREDKFDNVRNVRDETNGKQTLLNRILREEIAELENDIKLQELIYQEILDDVVEWLIDDYEKQENYIINMEQIVCPVFCPVCQKFEMIVAPGGNDVTKKLTCKCGIIFNYSGTMNDFHITMQKCLMEHGDRCDQNLIFFIEPTQNDRQLLLNTFCDSCDYYFVFK